jgi:hypothetical protein
MSIPITNKQAIINRLATGERLKDIAHDYGITSQAISLELADDPDYKQAMLLSVDAKLDKREEELELCSDQLTFSRARELLSHARWQAERIHRAKYGKDTIDAPTSAPTFNVILSSPHTLTIVSDQGGVKIEDKGQG